MKFEHDGTALLSWAASRPEEEDQKDEEDENEYEGEGKEEPVQVDSQAKRKARMVELSPRPQNSQSLPSLPVHAVCTSSSVAGRQARARFRSTTALRTKAIWTSQMRLAPNSTVCSRPIFWVSTWS